VYARQTRRGFDSQPVVHSNSHVLPSATCPPFAAGLVLGIGGSVGLSRFIGALLFGVNPRDAVTFIASAAAVVVIAVFAASVPAIRSSRIDPGQVLRES
jgi:hypothetical protein